ncbi:phosphotransferase family protein [Mycoplasma procyoni]|uniref:phosphotransferase family protein n=1 Tax=Mycoplasma procyoni TaxID=568784 RepID=UPI00197BE31C|nr:phosphotransferase [Mycoplasma procyoni]MBN3534625.1 phosphotransferase [Mycoplasma procyoni]
MNIEKIPKEFRDKLTQITKIYSGKQNHTYSAFLENQKVQIRIPQNDFVDWENEAYFLKDNKDYIFYQKGFFVKKWFQGEQLNKELLKNKETILFSKLKELQNLNKPQLKEFDWNILEIKDKKFSKKLNRYKNDLKTVSHGDLRFKNLLINEQNKIKIIDFEWVRLNDPYFDFVCLHLYLGISKKKIINFFELNKTKFDDFIYLVNKFNKNWEKAFYKSGKI